MTVSQIDQLKAEIASLEQEALKELKTRREALIAEIASVDEQIAALLGQSRINPLARKRAGKRQTTSTSDKDAETPVADVANNGHQNKDALDRQNEDASPEASSRRSDDQRVQPQTILTWFPQSVPPSLRGFRFSAKIHTLLDSPIHWERQQ